ncbi:DsbA family protein [Candidatus Saccharibacteria bacterium]|nr:DsbA family protein [Candidatus Saccharibacteria bacterium]MCL1963235.1 DsbA family protein [Candidatus Saccharibacteria bacterium]
MNKRLWVVLAILTVGIVVGAAIFAGKQSSEKVDVSAIDEWKLATEKTVGKNQIPDHYLGDKDSKVVVVLYEDFACSHCNQISGDIEQIYEDYKDRVLFIYRNFSLGYPNSQVTQQAAEAAYLAGGEEAYWQMNELLYSTRMWISQAVPEQERKDTLNGYAKEIGLDVDKFNKFIEDRYKNGIRDKIERDKGLGVKVGVNGTPALFVNEKKVNKAINADIRAAIDVALKKAGITTGAPEKAPEKDEENPDSTKNP